MAPAQWTRVIVLTPPQPGGGPDAALKAEFAQRDWYAVEHSDPCMAMAELCLREKSQAARAAWGLQRMEQIALVVLQPDAWRQHAGMLDDLTDAVKAFVPSASIWIADDHDLKPIHRGLFNHSPLIEPTQEPAPRPQAAGHTLRLADADAGHVPAAGNHSEPHAPEIELLTHGKSSTRGAVAQGAEETEEHPTRLTRQEIDMLLDATPPAAGSELA